MSSATPPPPTEDEINQSSEMQSNSGLNLNGEAGAEDGQSAGRKGGSEGVPSSSTKAASASAHAKKSGSSAAGATTTTRGIVLRKGNKSAPAARLKKKKSVLDEAAWVDDDDDDEDNSYNKRSIPVQSSSKHASNSNLDYIDDGGVAPGDGEMMPESFDQGEEYDEGGSSEDDVDPRALAYFQQQSQAMQQQQMYEQQQQQAAQRARQMAMAQGQPQLGPHSGQFVGQQQQQFQQQQQMQHARMLALQQQQQQQQQQQAAAAGHRPGSASHRRPQSDSGSDEEYRYNNSNNNRGPGMGAQSDSDESVGHVAPQRGYGAVNSQSRNSSRSPSPPRGGFRGGRPAGPNNTRLGMPPTQMGMQARPGMPGRPPMGGQMGRPGQAPVGQPGMLRPGQPGMVIRPGQPGAIRPQIRPGMARPPSAPEKPVPPPPDPVPGLKAELLAAQSALDNTTKLLLDHKKQAEAQLKEFQKKADAESHSFSMTIEQLRRNLETFKRDYENEKARRKEAEKVAQDATHRAADSGKRAEQVQADLDSLIKDSTMASGSHFAREKDLRAALETWEARAREFEGKFKSAELEAEREKAQVKFLADEIAKLTGTAAGAVVAQRQAAPLPPTPSTQDPFLQKKIQDQDMVIAALRDKITKDGDWIRKLEAELSQLRTRKGGFSIPILGTLGGNEDPEPDKLRVVENELLRTRVELGSVSKEKSALEGKIRQAESIIGDLQRQNEGLKNELARYQAWYASVAGQQQQQQGYYGAGYQQQGQQFGQQQAYVAPVQQQQYSSPVVGTSTYSPQSYAQGLPPTSAVAAYAPQASISSLISSTTAVNPVPVLERIPLPSKGSFKSADHHQGTVSPVSSTSALQTPTQATSSPVPPSPVPPSPAVDPARLSPVETKAELVEREPEQDLVSAPSSGYTPISASNPDTQDLLGSAGNSLERGTANVFAGLVAEEEEKEKEPGSAGTVGSGKEAKEEKAELEDVIL